MDLFSFTNALLRPCGKSVYEDATNGISRMTGIKDIDNELGSELGYPLFQETQMEFVMKFCGYSFLDADKLRKCVAKGTLVTMADGTLKPIEEIKVGDRVISFDGKIFSGQNVINTWSNGTKKVVRVKLEDGIELKCTPDHKLLTQDGWKEAAELNKKDWIYTPKKIMCDSDNLRSNQKLTSLQYWFLGAMIGDGTIGQKWQLRFTNSDENVINRVLEALYDFCKNPKYTITEVTGKSVDRIYCVNILGNTRKAISKYFEEENINKKAAEKHIPDRIMKLNVTEKLLHFISGLFNTDGGYCIGRGSIEYYTISKTLVNQIRTLLQKIGIYSKISIKKVSGYEYNSYTLSIMGSDNLSIFNKMIVPFIIGNKKNEFAHIISEYGDKKRYVIPERCKEEIKTWCDLHGVSARNFCLEHGIADKSISNKCGLSADIANNLLQDCNAPFTYDVLHGDYMLVPVVSIEEYGKEEVYDIEVENTHNFVANNMVVHNCVAKKIGTREQLPVIKEGFYEHGKKDLDLTEEQAENVINPFLQCILDATRYSFCRIHAYSYSYIGYICAYLKYYYPMEYLTACLNVWRSKEEKTNECIEYAKLKNIKILEPRFRHGTADYSFDKDSNTIYKGMLSIKYLNEACSNYLYSLRNETYPSFVDLLYTLSDSKSINSRQLEVLVKLDFFEEFGNSKELLRIINMFSYFKEGKAKSLSKSKISEDSIVYSIISRNSKETEKTFTQLNTPKILSECEELIKSWRMSDFSIKDKALTQRELLGYINIVTNKKEDRPKVLVFEKRILKSKKTNKSWAVMIEAQSLGSGKKSKYTILYKNYEKEPFSEFDTLFIKKWSKKGEYFYIDQYEKIFETS